MRQQYPHARAFRLFHVCAPPSLWCCSCRANVTEMPNGTVITFDLHPVMFKQFFMLSEIDARLL